MLDCHVHLERGPYTAGWVVRFVETALARGIDELWFLEHSHRFAQFEPMYAPARDFSAYQRDWYSRRFSGIDLGDYLTFATQMKLRTWPIKLRFGLEVCWFSESADLIHDTLARYPLDFAVGSVHWIDGFGFDHKSYLWDGVDVDRIYCRYYELMEGLIKSGLFGGVAHPDSIKVFGRRPSYDLRPEYESLADLLKKQGMYAEESGGLRLNYGKDQEPGMNAGMLDIFKKHGIRLLTASDAHRPEDTGANISELEKLILT